MQISASAMRSELDKLDALEPETDHRALFSIFVTLVPNTTLRFQQLRIFDSETIQTRTPQAVFTVNKESQSHRKFAKRLLIGFDGSQSRGQIALTVRCTSSVELTVHDRRRKRTD